MQELERRPYDGDKYFPKALVNSEIELTFNTINISISDEETKLNLEIQGYDINFLINTVLDEMKTSLEIGGFGISINDQKNSAEIVRSGRVKSFFDEKNKAPENIAIKSIRIYRPAELFVPSDRYLTLNMHEVDYYIAPLTVMFSHNILNNLLLIKEALELDKCFRDNLDLIYIKAFNKYRKKYKLQKMIQIDLKKYILSKQIAKKLFEFQEEIQKNIKEISSDIMHMLFHYQYHIEGGVINFNDFSSCLIFKLLIPSTKIELQKSKECISIKGLGWNFQSSNNPNELYKFLTTICSSFFEKIKNLKKYKDYKN